MQREREPERPSSVVTDIVRATEQGCRVRTSYIRLSISALLVCSEIPGAISGKDFPNHE